MHLINTSVPIKIGFCLLKPMYVPILYIGSSFLLRKQTKSPLRVVNPRFLINAEV